MGSHDIYQNNDKRAKNRRMGEDLSGLVQKIGICNGLNMLARVNILAKSSILFPSQNENMLMSSLFFYVNTRSNLHGVLQMA